MDDLHAAEVHTKGVPMIYIKEYKTEQGTIIAACDEELLGNSYTEGALLLDLDKYAGFYKGELISEDEASERITAETLHTANMVGKRVVDICISKGLATDSAVMQVQGVPFLQIYKIE